MSFALRALNAANANETTPPTTVWVLVGICLVVTLAMISFILFKTRSNDFNQHSGGPQLTGSCLYG